MRRWEFGIYGDVTPLGIGPVTVDAESEARAMRAARTAYARRLWRRGHGDGASIPLGTDLRLLGSYALNEHV